jgi:hypothetical protein
MMLITPVYALAPYMMEPVQRVLTREKHRAEAEVVLLDAVVGAREQRMDLNLQRP